MNEQNAFDFGDEHRRKLNHWLAKDERNENTYRAFCQIAIEASRAGMSRWSARGITQILRWKTAVEDGDTMFKINNNIIASMARCAMEDHHELNGFFEVRT